jgi:hypothetical protein
MRTALLIAFAAILVVTVGTLAMMNNACKTSHHSWCRPTQIGGHTHSIRPPKVQSAVSS